MVFHIVIGIILRHWKLCCVNHRRPLSNRMFCTHKIWEKAGDRGEGGPAGLDGRAEQCGEVGFKYGQSGNTFSRYVFLFGANMCRFGAK